MAASYVVYIDESGDEGFRFGGGSSIWFVLSGVITRKPSDLATVRLVDQVRLALGKPPRKPLHFRDLRHEHRLPFVAEIAKGRLRTVCVLVHKPSLRNRETFGERYLLYRYAARHLLERVSWCCRDSARPDDGGDGSAQIVFSNRASMCYQELRDYLDVLERRTSDLDVRIDWSVIRPGQITAFTPGKRMGLQIADAVAGCFFYAVEKNRHGFTEDRYARMLKPVVYHHRGTYVGYGLKFWPRESLDLTETAESLAWVRTTYQ